MLPGSPNWLLQFSIFQDLLYNTIKQHRQKYLSSVNRSNQLRSAFLPLLVRVQILFWSRTTRCTFPAEKNVSSRHGLARTGLDVTGQQLHVHDVTARPEITLSPGVKYRTNHTVAARIQIWVSREMVLSRRRNLMRSQGGFYEF